MAASGSEASYGEDEFDAESWGGSESAAVNDTDYTEHTEELSDVDSREEEAEERGDEHIKQVEAKDDRMQSAFTEARNRSQRASQTLGSLKKDGSLADSTRGNRPSKAMNRCDQEAWAAARIQSVHRGRKDRQKVMNKHIMGMCSSYLAAVTAKSIHNTSEHFKELRKKDAEWAAQLDYDEAIMNLQASDAMTRAEAAAKIQRIHRGRHARQQAKYAKEKRRRQREEQVRQEERAAREEAAHARKEEKKSSEQEFTQAAVKLQAYHRGRTARRRMQDFEKKRGHEREHQVKHRPIQEAPAAKAQSPASDVAQLSNEHGTSVHSKAAAKDRNVASDVADAQAREPAAARSKQEEHRSGAATKEEEAYRKYLNFLAHTALQGLYVIAITNAKQRQEQDKLPPARSSCLATKEAENTRQAIDTALMSEDAQRAIIKIQIAVRKALKIKEKQRSKTRQEDDCHPEKFRARLEQHRRTKDLAAIQEKAATDIQRICRGHLERKKTKDLTEKRSRVREEAKKAQEARESEWEQGFRSSFCTSSRITLSQADASARRIQKFARRASLKSKTTSDLDKVANRKQNPLATCSEEVAATSRSLAASCRAPTKDFSNEATDPKEAVALEEQDAKSPVSATGTGEEDAVSPRHESRRTNVMKREGESPTEMDEAILRIQAAQRRRQAKKEAKRLKKEKEEMLAILKIQAIRRGVTARRELEKHPMTPEELEEGDLDSNVQDRGVAVLDETPEAAALANEQPSSRPLTRRSFDAQWADNGASSSATEVLEVATDAVIAPTNSLQGAAPPADVLEAAAVAATAARPITRRSFDAQHLEDGRSGAADAEATTVAASDPVARPVTRRNVEAQSLDGNRSAAIAPDEVQFAAEPAEVFADAGITESVVRGSPSVCDLAVQCLGDSSGRQDGDMAFCGRPRHAASERQTCCFVQDRQAQTDPWLLEGLTEADFSADDANVEYHVLEAQAPWPSPAAPQKPESHPRRSPKSGRRLRRPPPVGTIRAGPVYKAPLRAVPVPVEATAAARGFSEPRQMSAGSAPPSRGRSDRPQSVREVMKPPSSAPSAMVTSGSAGPNKARASASAPSALTTSASPGLGKIRQPPPMLSTFGRVLNGPTPRFSAHNLQGRAQSPPTSGSQLRRLCDPLWTTPRHGVQGRFRAPLSAPATAPAEASMQQTAAIDVGRDRQDTRHASQPDASVSYTEGDTSAEAASLAETSRNPGSAGRAGLSSAPAAPGCRKPKAVAVSVPHIMTKPRSAKLTSNRPPWQDVGTDARLEMNRLPWLSDVASLDKAAMYADRDVFSHGQRPLDRRHVEEDGI